MQTWWSSENYAHTYKPWFHYIFIYIYINNRDLLHFSIRGQLRSEIWDRPLKRSLMQPVSAWNNCLSAISFISNDPVNLSLDADACLETNCIDQLETDRLTHKDCNFPYGTGSPVGSDANRSGKVLWCYSSLLSWRIPTALLHWIGTDASNSVSSQSSPGRAQQKSITLCVCRVMK